MNEIERLVEERKRIDAQIRALKKPPRENRTHEIFEKKFKKAFGDKSHGAPNHEWKFKNSMFVISLYLCDLYFVDGNGSSRIKKYVIGKEAKKYEKTLDWLMDVIRGKMKMSGKDFEEDIEDE